MNVAAAAEPTATDGYSTPVELVQETLLLVTPPTPKHRKRRYCTESLPVDLLMPELESSDSNSSSNGTSGSNGSCCDTAMDGKTDRNILLPTFQLQPRPRLLQPISSMVLVPTKCDIGAYFFDPSNNNNNNIHSSNKRPRRSICGLHLAQRDNTSRRVSRTLPRRSDSCDW